MSCLFTDLIGLKPGYSRLSAIAGTKAMPADHLRIGADQPRRGFDDQRDRLRGKRFVGNLIVPIDRAEYVALGNPRQALPMCQRFDRTMLARSTGDKYRPTRFLLIGLATT